MSCMICGTSACQDCSTVAPAPFCGAVHQTPNPQEKFQDGQTIAPKPHDHPFKSRAADSILSGDDMAAFGGQTPTIIVLKEGQSLVLRCLRFSCPEPSGNVHLSRLTHISQNEILARRRVLIKDKWCGMLTLKQAPINLKAKAK